MISSRSPWARLGAARATTVSGDLAQVSMMRILAKLRGRIAYRASASPAARHPPRTDVSPTWSMLILASLLLALLIVSQCCTCLYDEASFEHNRREANKPAMFVALEPSSIFSSLIGGSVESMTSQQAQQTADQQHQNYKNGQTSDKVTLPGDILLGGLFPIHMKGE